MAGRKVFVGSLPDRTGESEIRQAFKQYGDIEDVFVKQNCEPGRQWAFVTFATAQQASDAKEATDRTLRLPGSDRAVEVMVARNQGKFGHGESGPSEQRSEGSGNSSSQGNSLPSAKKIFVGSLPDNITESMVREEFSKYGQISDLFLKTGCESGKQWAFVTFMHSDEAQAAKSGADRQMLFPGAERPCEVMLARNQGLHGQDPLVPSTNVVANLSQGPVKIFCGSLPDSITESQVRAEFSKYGQITDVFLKTGCETNKQWAFITYATNAQAQQAKDTTDRVLRFPDSTGPCEVMFAKNQGKNGQDPLDKVPASRNGAQLALPGAPVPAQYSWRCYYTTAGLPYYHNHSTGVTQWECPPELQYAAMAAQPGMPHMHYGQVPAAMYAPVYGGMYPAPAPGFAPY